MSSISKPQLNTIVRAFQPILNKKCWALSNGKKPWNYDRGYALEWRDCDLLETFWQVSDKLYDRNIHGAGLGLFLGVENRIACLDLDGPLTNGKPASETAQRIVHGSCTFTEISLSGQGLHLFFEVDDGTEPFHLRSGISAKDGDFFTQKRFIRLTGQLYGKEYPVRYLQRRHFEYFRENFGKIPAALPAVRPFTGHVSDRSLASRLSGACIPYRTATISSPQPFHNEHGGIVECIETLCPNVNQHTSDASPNAKFVRCADGLITGRCFHQHCDPETLRAAGTSLAGMLTAKIRAAGDPTVVFTLLEKCEKMGMPPLKDCNNMTEAQVHEVCHAFVQGITGARTC